MIVLIIIVVAMLLVSLAGVAPHKSGLSEFELRRRLDDKLPGAMLEWRRREVRGELLTLRRIIVAFLLVLVSVLIIVRFGWLWGWLGVVGLILLYNRLAALSPLRRYAQGLYDRHEADLLRWIDRHRRWLRPFRGPADSVEDPQLASRQELLHLVDDCRSDILSSDECRMIHGALGFSDKRVKDYMTPRSSMEVIGKNELLGPLVLDDLHKTGHSHFPVLDGDIDHIVGLLHLHNLLALVDKRSITVGEVMEPKVLFIHENQLLSEALSVCIKYRRHLLVVINEFRETVGVITIEDAVVQLIGRPIVDHYDNHDDLAAVAGRHSSNGDQPVETGGVQSTVVK